MHIDPKFDVRAHKKLSCRLVLNHALALVEGRELLGLLANGELVWTRSDEDHLLAHPESRDLLRIVLPQLLLEVGPGETQKYLHDCGHVIGSSSCVPVTQQDEIIYARRPGRRFGCTRFVKNREAVPCTTFRVILHRNKHGLVVVTTAYVGGEAPPEPFSKLLQSDPEWYDEAVKFWTENALVWNDEYDADWGIRTETDEYWGQRPEEA